MTGIAAVTLCTAFTSCSHDMTPASQEEINAVQAKKVVDTYNAAFIAKFGQPASNQDWGFGSGASARTRANAGANYATTHEYKDANGNVIHYMEPLPYIDPNTGEPAYLETNYPSLSNNKAYVCKLALTQ